MTLKQFNQKYCRFRRRSKSQETSCENNQATPLSQSCKKGRKRICKITGDRKLCAQMANLGVYPGEEVEVICSAKGSRCVLKVHGGNITLDPDTSSNILVESI